jgi:predicted Zn-dependent peptidase
MYKKTRLDNGVRVITHHMPGMQSVTLGIWIKVGSRHETEEYKGISHFLEHLLFKGTKKYSCRRIKESIEGVGGSLNGFTSEETTCYLVKIPARHLDLALDILSDMVINSLIPAHEVERERTVILEELKMYKDQPRSYVYELLDGLLWPRQPLGTGVIGTTESVSRIQQGDLARYKKHSYTPFNIVVSAAGLLAHERLTRKVEKMFSGLDGTNVNRFIPAREEQRGPQLKALAKDTEQTHLALGFHGFKRDHPLRYALNILHLVMGGNMSSRLFNTVREKKGLAYEIGTHVRRFHDTGALIVHAGIDNLKVEKAIHLIFEELSKVKYALVSNEEFKRAKEFYLGQLMLALEDTLDHMIWIGESTLTLDKTDTLDAIIAEVNKVTRQDIREVAGYVFKEEKINLALIGPAKMSRKKIEDRLHIR